VGLGVPGICCGGGIVLRVSVDLGKQEFQARSAGIRCRERSSE